MGVDLRTRRAANVIRHLMAASNCVAVLNSSRNKVFTTAPKPRDGDLSDASGRRV